MVICATSSSSEARVRRSATMDDVVTVRVKAGAIEALDKLESSKNFFVLVHLLENFLVETLDAE